MAQAAPADQAPAQRAAFMAGDHEGYSGPVTIRIDGTDATDVEVRAILRGQFDPIDGRYHWYGRLAADERLAALAGRAPVDVTVVTPEGAGEGRLGDADFWGRLRVTGTGRPPFALPTLGDESGRAARADGFREDT